jgi:hypothetical protein
MVSVVVPGDVLIRSASYTVAGDDQPMTGTITADSAVHEVDKLITHVPAGDYTVSAHADSTDRQSVCEASLPIRVSKDTVARVRLAPSCKGSVGNVIIGIGVNCLSSPLFNLLVSPESARVGESVLGRASAARPDGGALTYVWSAPSGTFSDPKAEQTMFTCATPGPVEVKVQVTDDQSCQQSLSAVVTCLPRPDGGADANAGNDAGSNDAGAGNN